VCVYVMGGVDEDITNSASICSRKLRGFHACNHEHGNMCVSVYACMCVVCVCVCVLACMAACIYVWVLGMFVYTFSPGKKERRSRSIIRMLTYSDVC
jgi:hypothetical protein